MPERRPDRRVQRTRRRLKDALLALVNERGYDRISIRDITERADVGRSTFYSHFTSKDDLLFSGFDHWLRSLAAHVPPGADAARFQFVRPLLDHVWKQRPFLRAILVRGNDVRIRRRITALFADMIGVELERMRPDVPERVREARAFCVAGAFLELCVWWIDRASGLSAADVDAVFQDVVAPSPEGE